MYKWTAGKGAVGWQKRRGSPISVAEVHILKFNLALLKAKGPCSRKVLHLGECHQCVPPLRAWYSPVIRNTMQVSASQNHTPLSSLTSASSFSKSNMFSMSMKLVWIILQKECWLEVL